ncbi:MAG: iron ABC transporter permease [Eubacteriales bacterium]|nr:iron ABC transporter permease [Eubacteriales bacterium]
MKKISGTGLRFGAVIALFCASAVLGIFFGSTGASIWDALRAIAENDKTSAAYRIFAYVRLPRVLAAALAGSALAVAGAIIQAALHNPMAAPNIIGVNSGAGLAASLVVALFPSLLWAMPAAAFAGALCACLLIWLISARTGASRLTITLIGVAISSIFSAGINAVKTIFPDSLYNANAFLVGGLAGVNMARLLPAAVPICAGIAAACVCARHIDVLSMGEETAASLGMQVGRFRLFLLLLASVLAGSAVSFAGLLGFVGLIVPHMSRRIIGGNHRLLIPFCALGGASLVLLCDLLGRVLFAPYELPVGILLSFIGGPFFIGQILSQRRRAL